MTAMKPLSDRRSRVLVAALAAALLAPAAGLADDLPLPPPPPPIPPPPPAAPGAPAAPASGTAEKAAKVPKLAVVAFSVDETQGPAARLSYQGELVASKLGRHEVLDVVAILDPEGVAARAARAQEGRSELEQARKLYDELELEKAIQHCDKAMQALEKADHSVAFEDYSKAWILKIASLIANADEAAAAGELQMLLPADAKTAFDPNIFAPDFIAQVKQKREELAAKANLSLEVRTKPLGARIYVDGQFKGVTPMEVKNLAPGEHFVMLVAPGHEVLYKRIKPGIGANVIETLTPTFHLASFQERLDKIRLDFRGPGRNVAVRELGQKLGADQVLMLGVNQRDPNQLQLLGVRVAASDGHELQHVDEPVPVEENAFMATADSLLNRLLGSDAKRKEGRAVEKTGGGFVWRPKHTGYALIGAAAVALGAGVLFGVQAMDAASSYQQQSFVQNSPELANLESSGKSSAIIADVSYLVGLIAGGTGAYLAVTDRSAAGDDEANPKLEERKTVTGRTQSDDAGLRERKTRRRAPPKDADEDAPEKKPAKKTDDDDWRD